MHKNLITVAISHSIIHRPLNAPRDLASNDATERIMKWSISLTSEAYFHVFHLKLNKKVKVWHIFLVKVPLTKNKKDDLFLPNQQCKLKDVNRTVTVGKVSTWLFQASSTCLTPNLKQIGFCRIEFNNVRVQQLS